jgi:hypothetical protein
VSFHGVYVELSSDLIYVKRNVQFMIPFLWTGGIHTVFLLSNATNSLILWNGFNISYPILLSLQVFIWFSG